MRDKLLKVYEKISTEFEEIQNHEYNTDVEIMKMEYESSDLTQKEDLRKQILERLKAFKTQKRKIENTLKMFESSSKNLAEKENLNFDEKFNKNQYLNYFQFTKNFETNDMSIKEYFKYQEKEYLGLTKFLGSQSPHEPKIEIPDHKMFRESDVSKYD